MLSPLEHFLAEIQIYLKTWNSPLNQSNNENTPHTKIPKVGNIYMYQNSPEKQIQNIYTCVYIYYMYTCISMYMYMCIYIIYKCICVYMHMAKSTV